jgi:hypothetical protein
MQNLFASDEKILTMVYKPLSKTPYIEADPDNSGLYKDLMEMAVKNIGYKLKIVRVPKARSYKMLKNGVADIYASGEFNLKRSEFLFYIPNGLVRDEELLCITPIDIPEIKSLSEVKKHNLTWFVERGSTWVQKSKNLGIKNYKIHNTTIEIAVKFFKSKRKAMFIVLRKDIDKYLSSSHAEKNVFKIHENCGVTKNNELFTGFSRKSKHYAEEKNGKYHKNQELSSENFPVRLVADSIPDRLARSLQDLINKGEVKNLLKKYNLE